LNFLDYIERHKFSILGTIVIHVIILVWMNLQLVVSIPKTPNERVVIELDFSEIEEEENLVAEEMTQNSFESNSDLMNVAANSNQDQTTYTNQNFSKSQADQEVLDELMKLEQAEFNSIEHSEEENNNEQVKNSIEKGLVKENAQQNDDASFGKDVKATANYYLPNRKPQRKPTPSYKCTAEGIVRVIIKVNQKGRVVGTSIDEATTNTQNECLRSEAINYAKRWRFTQEFNDEARKEGWIAFTYAAQ